MNSSTSGWLVLTRNFVAGSHPQDDNFRSPFAFGRPSEGQYGLFLTGTTATDPLYRLTQIGEIPGDAQFLSHTYTGRPFMVTVNGIDVTPANSFPSPNPRTGLADVSIFAGQTVELTFTTTRAVPVLGGDGPTQLDAIAFVVPEPSTVGLWLLGAGALISRWAWSRKRLW